MTITLTEAEAKTKWCPFARYVFNAPHYASGNRYGEDEAISAKEAAAACMCLASGCMAWRGDGVRLGKEIERRKIEPGSVIPSKDWKDGWGASNDGYWVRTEHIEVGYCGLARDLAP